MITLYIIQGIETKRLYIGITNHLGRRLREHRKKQSKGSLSLGKFKLIHKEEFTDYASARQREKFLKSGQGRKWISDNLSDSGAGG